MDEKEKKSAGDENSSEQASYSVSEKTQKSSFAMRLRGLIVLLGVAALLGTGLYLEPARLEKFNSGYRFLPPCGFLVRHGYPCPTCYMTRSFSYMMHGRPIRSFLSQPFGAFLCLLVVYLGCGSVRVLFSGKPWKPLWVRWSRRRILIVLAAAFLAGWIFRLVYGTFITHEFPLR